MLLLWAVGLWFDLIDVVLYDVRVNARECSIRAARDQITHRVVKGSLGACCWSSLSVLYLLFLQSVLYSSTNEACVCRVMIFMLILNGISGAQLLWSIFISTKQILSYIHFFDYECSLPGMVPYANSIHCIVSFISTDGTARAL